jgi:hypothetical protein
MQRTVSLRVDDATLARIERVAAARVARGVRVSTSDAVRACLMAGLAALEERR